MRELHLSSLVWETHPRKKAKEECLSHLKLCSCVMICICYVNVKSVCLIAFDVCLLCVLPLYVCSSKGSMFWLVGQSLRLFM